MRKTVDAIVIACIFIAVYINLTDFPKPAQPTNGLLIKLGVEK
jgi:hypothetical protein